MSLEEQFKLGHYPYLQHELPPQRIPGRKIAAICTAILIIALAWWFRPRSAPVKIAVVPLDNLSHDPADEYLADGLTDELIQSLATFDGLAPQPLTSSFAFNRKKLNAWQTGEQLSADYIVEGSVLRSGDQLRADAKLVRVREDVTVWSGKFARHVSDLRDLQDEISKTIVANLPIRLGLRKKHAALTPEVYNLYLRATSLGLEDGIPLFEQVVSKDPAFAAAYAGLASSLAYKDGGRGLRPHIDLSRMRAAARNARNVPESRREKELV
jgi:TolB-like protein